MAFRLDRVGRFDAARKDASGFLVAPANLTRTGIFVYDGPGGTKIRELRPADEVFHADSLASLRSAPLTDERHRTVTVKNWRETSIGHVDGEVHKDGIFVAGHVKVTDEPSIERVDKKELFELSCGYKCDIEQTSGTYEGEHYDAVQRNIRYNHVALGPENWGRAGGEVRLHTDGGDEDEYVLGHYAKIETSDRVDATPTSEPMTPEEKARFDAIEAELKALKAQAPAVDTLQAKVDGLTSENKKLQGDLAQANDSKRFDAAVEARTALVTKAGQILGSEFKADGKTDLAIMGEVVKKLDPEFKADGKSAEYVKAAFDFATARNDKVQSAREDTQLALPTVATARDDSSGDKVLEAQDRAAYVSRNLWRGDAWLEKNPWKAGK